MKRIILSIASVAMAAVSFAQAPVTTNRAQAPSQLRNLAMTRPDKNKVERPVPYALPNPTVANGSGQSSSRSFGREIIGTTYYDLQTNSSVCNRIVRNADGTIAATWTIGPTPAHSSFADRGTGYNYRTASGWDTPPTVRVEGKRTGWPSIVNLDNGTEAFVCHNTTISNIQITSRPTKGTGAWTEDETTLLSPLPAGSWWPRLVSGGTDGNTIHSISITYPVASGGALYKGLDGALLYSRSQDGGATWDSLYILIPDLDTSSFLGFGGDTYAIDAKGNTVAILAGDATQDLILLKSTDNGDTWTKTIVDDFPIDKWDYATQISDINGDGVADTLETHDGAMAVLIDNNNQVHAFTGYMRILEDDPATAGYSYFPYTDGIKYWNESMGQDSTVIIATVIDRDQSGVIEYPTPTTTGGLAVGSTGNSVTSYPSAGIAANGTIYLTYSSIYEGTDNGEGKSFRHQYLMRSVDGGSTWSAPIDLIPADGDPDFTEGTFGAIARRVDGFAHIIYQEDGEPGHSLYGATPGDTDPGNINQSNNIVYNAVDTNTFSTSSVKELNAQNGMLVFPNPASELISIALDAGNTEAFTLSLTDLNGREVMRSETRFNGVNQVRHIDINGIAPGIYNLRAVSAERSITQRVVKY
jgi:hypothetical protein